jgi:hypothetical protein
MCIEAQREAEKSGLGGQRPADWGSLIDPHAGDNDVLLNDLEMDVS